MKTTLSSLPQAEQHNTSSLAEPIVVALALFLVVVVLRYTEVFVSGLNALPDKSIVSKVLGFILVLGYLRVLRKPLRSIGLHSRNFNKAFLIGGLSLLILYVTLYVVQFHRLNIAGESPRLVFAAINKQTGVMGGLAFTWFYLFGQIVNAFMEEGIFRGVMLPHLMRRFRFWQANALQAFLFGLAHLVWPLSSWVRGQATAEEAIAEAVPLMIATTVGGLVFGYLYYRTDSLWTAWFAHLIDNVIGLFFHIQIASRSNAETDILMLASIGFISLVLLAWIVAKRSNLPTLKPWAAN
jgi:uncharacterized protein